MRTDKRYQTVGVLVGVGIGAAASWAYQHTKLKKEGNELSWKNVDGWQLLLWSVIGGFIGYHAGNGLYNLKAFHTENPDFSASQYLTMLLKGESIEKDRDHFNHVLKYKERIKTTLQKVYQKKLADAPIDAGSLKNRTVIASDYDVDIIVPFKRKSFHSLASMHDHVYKKMNITFGAEARVVKNKRTIGITFEEMGREIHFDIAPGREIKKFLNDGLLNMYVSADWLFGNDSSVKVNVTKQNKTIHKEVTEVIRLLKIYAVRNNLSIPPVIISQVTIKALNPKLFGLSRSRKENLLNAMAYLADKLEAKNISDSSNTNNNLLDKMNDLDRTEAVDLLSADLAKVESDPRYLVEIFKEMN